jgi:hypothetical protein
LLVPRRAILAVLDPALSCSRLAQKHGKTQYNGFVIEIIYSIDTSQYQAWQADLLDWSIRRVQQNCRITRLTALAPDQRKYQCLNRLWSISHDWMPSEAETVVIVDPDMVFVRPLAVQARKGAVLGQPYGYVYDLPWCPLVLHRDYVKEWATMSLPLARTIHAKGGGWVSDMWASSIVTTSFGLGIERKTLAVFNTDDNLGEASVIHYCYDHAGFYKRRYQVGQVVGCGLDTEVQRHLTSLVNERFCCEAQMSALSGE